MSARVIVNLLNELRKEDFSTIKNEVQNCLTASISLYQIVNK